jgi:hypothetical protein
VTWWCLHSVASTSYMAPSRPTTVRGLVDREKLEDTLNDMPGLMIPLKALCPAARENLVEVSPGTPQSKIRPPSFNGHQENPSLMAGHRSGRMTP